MIIGVAGKIGSGKDITGIIIQLLINGHSVEDALTKVNLHMNGKKLLWDKLCDWKIVKFADKLKDIICILLGCTREQLESHDYKETPLGEEWWYYKLSKFYEKAYIESLDKSSTEYRGFADLVDYNDFYTIPEHRQFYYQLIKPTPRLLLTCIGTECGRQIIHPNIWVNATMNDYKSKFRKDDDFVHTELSDGSLVKWKDNPIWEPTHYPNWIITDLRFPNEAKSIKDRDGFIIRLQRLESDINNIKLLKARTSSNPITLVKEHESETALDLYKFDYAVDNNGTILDLIERIKEILLIEKII